ncbi:MAG: OmpA family protein [Moraxellaceae bacterium]|nr:OmpA family protein [Moraxellaceae bacterium]
MMKKQLMVTAIASSMALAGCAVDPTTGQQTMDKRVAGALVGAALGAGVSKATGGEKTTRDAAIGAALGAGVGLYMQKQAVQLQQQVAGTGVEVKLDPKTNDINVTMPSSITFDVDNSQVKQQFTGTLNDLASTMASYDKTSVVVMGHTDSDGSDSYNQKLSERRAYSVASYLNNHGVAASRIKTIAYGESQPIASNATEAGKAKNRRVEIKINAPAKL